MKKVWSYGECIRAMLSLALPTSLWRLIERVALFGAAVMLARINYEHLVASAIITPILTLFMSAAMGALNSVNILISRELGKKSEGDHKITPIQWIVQQGLLYSACLAFVLIILFLFSSPFVFAISKSKLITQIASRFFYGYVIGVIPTLWIFNYTQMTIGLGKAWASVKAISFNTCLTLALGYCLTFGKLGFPQWGSFGLGLAFSISAWITVPLFVLYLHFHRFFKVFVHIHLKEIFCKSIYLAQLFHGIPMGLKSGINRLSFIATTILASWIGHIALVAQEVSVQYLFITIIPFSGLAVTAGKYVAQHVNDEFSNAIRITKVIILAGCPYCLVILSIYALFPKALASAFLDIHNPANQQVLVLIRNVLLIIGTSQIFEAIRSILTGALRGFPVKIGSNRMDTWYPMWWTLAITILFDAGIAYCFAFLLDWGIMGIFAARGIGLFLLAIILTLRVRKHITERAS